MLPDMFSWELLWRFWGCSANTADTWLSSDLTWSLYSSCSFHTHSTCREMLADGLSLYRILYLHQVYNSRYLSSKANITCHSQNPWKKFPYGHAIPQSPHCDDAVMMKSICLIDLDKKNINCSYFNKIKGSKMLGNGKFVRKKNKWIRMWWAVFWKQLPVRHHVIKCFVLNGFVSPNSPNTKGNSSVLLKQGTSVVNESLHGSWHT